MREHEEEDTEWRDVFGSDSEEPSSSAGTPAVSLAEEREEPATTPMSGDQLLESKRKSLQLTEAEQAVVQPAVNRKPPAVKKSSKMAIFKRRTDQCEAEMMATFLQSSPDKEDLVILKEAMHQLKVMRDALVEGTPWAHYPHDILSCQWICWGGCSSFIHAP